MAKLSESDRKDLERNPNVLKVTKSLVTYTAEFKIKAVKSFVSGETPEDIFKNAKIDLSLFGRRYSSKSIRRWKEIVDSEGEEGLKEEKRGRNARGRPKTKFHSKDDEIKHLKMEIFILKKLHALAESKKKKGTK